MDIVRISENYIMQLQQTIPASPKHNLLSRLPVCPCSQGGTVSLYQTGFNSSLLPSGIFSTSGLQTASNRAQHVKGMSVVEDRSAMASLNAAKQQLRSAMKQKLGAVSHESMMLQSRPPVFLRSCPLLLLPKSLHGLEAISIREERHTARPSHAKPSSRLGHFQ